MTLLSGVMSIKFLHEIVLTIFENLLPFFKGLQTFSRHLTSNRSDAAIFPKDQRMRLQIVDLPRRFALQIGLHGGNARVFGLLKNGLRRPRLDVFEFDEIARWMYFSSNRS